jgi:hypothetical protein
MTHPRRRLLQVGRMSPSHLEDRDRQIVAVMRRDAAVVQELSHLATEHADSRN